VDERLVEHVLRLVACREALKPADVRRIGTIPIGAGDESAAVVQEALEPLDATGRSMR
jgi:hypothetical protein